MIEISKLKTVLTFFAHPDDETLGAGGTLCKFSDAGCKIHLAIPVMGETSRLESNAAPYHSDMERIRRETLAAAEKLGVEGDNIYFGDFDDNKLDTYPLLDLTQWLEKVIDEVRPDLIITHHRFCTNIDHQRCHEAAIIASRPNVNSHIPMLCAEVPSSTGYLKPTQWEPNYFVEISEEQLERKVAAMQTYEGEVRPDPHPRSPEVLRALAKVRGSESGFIFAEAFMLQKGFW